MDSWVDSAHTVRQTSAGGEEMLTNGLRLLDHTEIEVGTIKPCVEPLAVRDAQNVHDVLDDLHARCRSQRHNRRLRELHFQHAQCSVIFPKVMSPAGHAMRFVDDEPSQHLVLVELLQDLPRLRGLDDALRSDVEQLQEWFTGNAPSAKAALQGGEGTHFPDLPRLRSAVLVRSCEMVILW